MKKLTDDIKLKLFDEHSEINSIEKICEKYNICRATAYNWLKTIRKIRNVKNFVITYADYYKLQKQLEKKH